MSDYEKIVALISQAADDVTLRNALKTAAIDSWKKGSYGFSEMPPHI